MAAPYLRIVTAKPAESAAIQAAELAFRETARRRYGNGEVTSELLELDCMAGEIAACVLALGKHYDRLNTAADIQLGYAIQRGKFDAGFAAECLCEGLELSPDGAAVLSARVKAAL